MRLLDSLKRAEEQGREVAHLGMERAGEMWEDAERRIRRKMRIHPRRSASADKARATSASAAPDSNKHAA